MRRGGQGLVEADKPWFRYRQASRWITGRSGNSRSLRWLSLAVLAVLGTLLFVWPGVARAGRTGLSTRPAATVNVIVIGDFYSYGYSTSQNPALRQSVPPTLQALNKIQSANARVKIDVLFIPVADA